MCCINKICRCIVSGICEVRRCVFGCGCCHDHGCHDRPDHGCGCDHDRPPFGGCVPDSGCVQPSYPDCDCNDDATTDSPTYECKWVCTPIEQSRRTTNGCSRSPLYYRDMVR